MKDRKPQKLKCWRCKETKSIFEFNPSHRGKTRSPICKNCSKEIWKEHLKKLKDAVYKKLGGKCIKCGYVGVALQLDHIKGGGMVEKRKLGDSRKIYRKVRDMSVEQAKKEYQLLCANCNWEKRIIKGEEN